MHACSDKLVSCEIFLFFLLMIWIVTNHVCKQYGIVIEYSLCHYRLKSTANEPRIDFIVVLLNTVMYCLWQLLMENIYFDRCFEKSFFVLLYSFIWRFSIRCCAIDRWKGIGIHRTSISKSNHTRRFGTVSVSRKWSPKEMLTIFY